MSSVITFKEKKYENGNQPDSLAPINIQSVKADISAEEFLQKFKDIQPGHYKKISILCGKAYFLKKAFIERFKETHGLHKCMEIAEEIMEKNDYNENLYVDSMNQFKQINETIDTFLEDFENFKEFNRDVMNMETRQEQLDIIFKTIKVCEVHYIDEEKDNEMDVGNIMKMMIEVINAMREEMSMYKSFIIYAELEEFCDEMVDYITERTYNDKK
jgi:hypothetical protein